MSWTFLILKFVCTKLTNSDILIETISRFCIFFFTKANLDVTYCLFTTSWFQDPDFKIQTWFWSNQTGPKCITVVSIHWTPVMIMSSRMSFSTSVFPAHITKYTTQSHCQSYQFLYLPFSSPRLPKDNVASHNNTSRIKGVFHFKLRRPKLDINENTFPPIGYSKNMVTTNFCSCHGSTAAMARAKFHCDSNTLLWVIIIH